MSTNLNDTKLEAERLFTKLDIASYLQVTTRNVEVWMRRGLPHRKLGKKCVRFDLNEVKDFFEKKCKVVRKAPPR